MAETLNPDSPRSFDWKIQKQLPLQFWIDVSGSGSFLFWTLQTTLQVSHLVKQENHSGRSTLIRYFKAKCSFFLFLFYFRFTYHYNFSPDNIFRDPPKIRPWFCNFWNKLWWPKVFFLWIFSCFFLFRWVLIPPMDKFHWKLQEKAG